MRVLCAIALIALAAQASAATCAQNTTVDHTGERVGSDYQWLQLPTTSTIDDCIKLCCGDDRCQVRRGGGQAKGEGGVKRERWGVEGGKENSPIHNETMHRLRTLK